MHADQFPITVQDLDLRKMGIQELSDSLETLRNLKRLSLGVNPFKSLKFVKLPVLSLCLMSFSHRRHSNSDYQTQLQRVLQFYSFLPTWTPTMVKLSGSYKHSNLYCWDAESSSYFKEFGFRKSQVVVPICYTDVYNEIKNSIDEDYVYQVFKRRKYW